MTNYIVKAKLEQLHVNYAPRIGITQPGVSVWSGTTVSSIKDPELENKSYWLDAWTTVQN